MNNGNNIKVLNAAHFYDELGLSTIPLDGKRPAFDLLPKIDGKPSWRPFTQRRSHEEERLAWFGAAQEIDRNVGIVTGHISGVVAVDVDSHDTARWAWEHLPRTEMITRSGNGKGHLYYRLPQGVVIHNRVKIMGRPIDLRGEGGYCVAAPSIHPDFRQHYQRVGSWSLVNVPEFLVDWIDRERKSVLSPITGPPKRPTNLGAYIARIASIEGQNGSNACFRVACICRDECGSFDEALDRLMWWNQSGAAVPLWSEKELIHKLEDAFVRSGLAGKE